MPLKTSSFKKEIFKQDFRNVGWVSIMYLVGLLFTLPLQLAMALSDDYGVEPSSAGLFASTFIFEIQCLFLFIMPVLMAVFLFRYMHVKSSSDFIHSLPIRREKLFNYHIASGLVFLIAPIILNSIILLVFIGAADVSEFYTVNDLGYWTGLMVIVTLLVFMSGVFVGTLTGLSAVQGVLTYILLVFPIGIFGLISFHLSFYITGFSESVVLDQLGQQLSPIVDVVEYYPMNPGEGFLPVDYVTLGIYVVVAVLFYLVSKFIYKKRQLESASQAIAVTWLKPIFKYGVTFCFALFGAMYFGGTQNTYPWIICGYVLGGLFGYFLSTMLVKKTWRVFSFSYWKSFAWYGLAVAILLSVIPLLMMGYEEHVPKSGEVESVFLGTDYYHYENYISSGQGKLIQSGETLEAVRKFHEKMIQEGNPLDRNGERFFIAYEMKNGDKVQRSYQIDQNRVETSLQTVAETKEYKEMNYPILNVDANQAQRINLHSPHMGDEVYIVDPVKISSFLEQIKEDIYEGSYENMGSSQGLESYGEIMLEGEEPVQFSLERFYEKANEWLQSEGLYDQVIVQAEDVNYVEVYPWDQSTEIPVHAAFEQMQRGNIDPLRIEDTQEVEQVLQGKTNQQNGSYLAGIYFRERFSHADAVLSFQKDEAPSFVKDYFDGKE
ncbi:DUF6449 domain-containing protein [Halobacillus seohaensis]|uniref:DUF6449 domain-containing protein n=1 Tax=Halobacillus seohaensis TaxID=447421 RepID=A0ABW2EMF3_9BACI